MHLAQICFWIAVAEVGYTYLIYPVALALWATLRPAPAVRRSDERRSVSVVIAAYNEEETIASRVREFDRLLRSADIVGEIIVVSDGSSDRTAEFAATPGDERVRVFALTANQGKAAALSIGCSAARNEIIVLADSRQVWHPNAMVRLLENFADPTVGAVSGELVLENAPGLVAGVGLYWKYEKWIRRHESDLDSTVGVTGAISAVRRELFRPIPPGTILDDVYWPLQVVLQGYRVVYDGRAIAFDRLPASSSQELRRKVRTLCGNFQLVTRDARILVPWQNRVWFQFFSHKLMRLAAPWALFTCLITSAIATGPIYRVIFICQLVCYSGGLFGILHPLASRSKFLSAAGSFLLLNAAAFVAFWVWAMGGSSRVWKKTGYVRFHAPIVNGKPTQSVVGE